MAELLKGDDITSIRIEEKNWYDKNIILRDGKDNTYYLSLDHLAKIIQNSNYLVKKKKIRTHVIEVLK